MADQDRPLSPPAVAVERLQLRLPSGADPGAFATAVAAALQQELAAAPGGRIERLAARVDLTVDSAATAATVARAVAEALAVEGGRG
jgi:hypothetical protein